MGSDDFSKVDYHIHTSFSDGALTPREVVDRYIENGYKQIAITDHDGVGGSIEAIEYAKYKPISIISGIEMSTKDEEENTIHILGYGIDLSAPSLNDALNRILAWRNERNEKLLKALNEFGYTMTGEELDEINKRTFIGKPNIAALMIHNGYASDIDDAFVKLLEVMRRGNINKKPFPTRSAIDLIHSVNGLAVFAHPMEVKKTGESPEAFSSRITAIFDRMRACGIDGIECYHPSASEEQAEAFRAYAERYKLVITTGSDYHSDDVRRDYEN